ncbi:MAG: ABC transporter permease [Verrucomicrobia bacterium]|nr:MAG: ABC transporter permease [Verrucomicrobiota bacterium]
MTASASPASSPAPGRPAPEAEPAEKGVSLWQDAWHRLCRNRLALFGGVTLVVLAVACLVGPWLMSTGYQEQNLQLGASPPSAEHWLGTDVLGRDMLARILYGGRISLAVGLCATFVSLTIGIVWGAVAGFFGGKLDAVMMRIVDILYALPFTIFVILLMVFSDAIAKQYNLGATWNLLILFAAIGAVEWLTMARIVRGQIMALRRQEFIEAAFSLGLSRRRIIFRHMLPNILGPVIVYTTLTIPAVMLLEAFLSFLGLGVQPPMSSWGSLIKEGADKMEEYPWLLIFPGTIFSLTLFSLNFLGDGLRDALDVRASKD